MTRVLFVCTGNVHRSALAERLLAVRLPPGSAVRAESAGTEARPWPGMEPSTRAVLEELGGDGSDFASRRLTAQLVTGAALVLGLAREHREAAVRLAPVALRRCFTLKEFVRLAAGAGGDAGAPGGEGPGIPERWNTVDRLKTVVTAAAARRGTTAPVPPEEDDIPDPWGMPPDVLHGCALEIDGVVSRVARLLDADRTHPPSRLDCSAPPNQS
ncbi:low molecular weight phosphatase family protein [Streptomyces sp. NPDC007264]|uniref:arsenate reductase/protein-tyrosine-phosphatase family protein n=1 Tax=Streptomyces sp. NPDC007264 TaxID=3364777 RepID=UPI0036DECEBA